MAEFEPGMGREPLNILESKIRYAMENTKSNRAAARFLHVSIPTYRKYATLYIDQASGKNLYELHKNQAGKRIKKNNAPGAHGFKKTDLNEILEGKHPSYNSGNLKKRLISECYMEEKCEECDYNEKRAFDYASPILLFYIDGDKKNHRRENLKMLCYNCSHLNGYNFFGRRRKDFTRYLL